MPFQEVKNKLIYQTLSKEALFAYYMPTEIHGYCQKCPNYHKIWSCPPLIFNPKDYLTPYECFVVMGVQTKTFDATRRSFGKTLIEFAETNSCEVLIAGNCHYCTSCNRINNQPCLNPKKMKFSLEALGFHVGEICENVLKVPLDWSKVDPTFMTVGLLMFKNHKEQEEMTEKIVALLEGALCLTE